MPTRLGSFSGNPCGGGSGNYSVVIGTANVTGSVTVTHAPADVTLGGNGCGGLVVGGNLFANSNSGDVSVQGTTVNGGNEYVQNNTGSVVVADNTVKDNLYCNPATGAGNKARHIYGTCTA